MTDPRASEFAASDALTSREDRRPLKHSFSASLTGAVKEIQQLLSVYYPPVPEVTHPGWAAATSIVWKTNHESAFRLQRFAWDRLALIRRDGEADPTREALESLEIVVRDFISDNGPTPQIGSTPTGSVELQWLAAGVLVSALFDASGEYNLFAVNPNDSVIFDADIPRGAEPPEELRVRLVNLLSEMSATVTVRPSSWH